VRDLGDDNALILRNRGLLTVGKTIPEAFNAMHRARSYRFFVSRLMHACTAASRQHAAMRISRAICAAPALRCFKTAR
jgi:hypothetical protein